jgi:hypothetical protein
VSIKILYIAADFDCCREQFDNDKVLVNDLDRQFRDRYPGLVMFETVVIKSDIANREAAKQGHLPNMTLRKLHKDHILPLALDFIVLPLYTRFPTACGSMGYILPLSSSDMNYLVVMRLWLSSPNRLIRSCFN